MKRQLLNLKPLNHLCIFSSIVIYNNSSIQVYSASYGSDIMQSTEACLLGNGGELLNVGSQHVIPHPLSVPIVNEVNLAYKTRAL